MAITCLWSEVLGRVEQNGNILTLYTGGNVPAVICADIENNEGETVHSLVSFICDKVHLENMLKDSCFEDFHSWVLDTKYNKDAFMIAKLLTKYGHQVTLVNTNPKGAK